MGTLQGPLEGCLEEKREGAGKLLKVLLGERKNIRVKKRETTTSFKLSGGAPRDASLKRNPLTKSYNGRG